MLFTRLAFAVAAAHGALAAPSPPSRGFGCGAPEPDVEHIQASHQFAAQEAAFAAEAAANRSMMIQAITNVDTYFHVVATSTSVSGGYLTVWIPLCP